MKQNVFIGFLLFLTVTLLYICYQYAQVEDLEMFLKPVVFIVSAFIGKAFIFVSQTGYVCDELGVTIGKSCSGVNYCMILLIVFVVSNLRRVIGFWQKLCFFLACVLVSYIITLFVNTSRIIASIYMLNFNLPFQKEAVHLGIGIVFFFLCLLFANLFVGKIIRYYQGGDCS